MQEREASTSDSPPKFRKQRKKEKNKKRRIEMLRQAVNKVYIEGILAENDLNYTSFTKNGKNVEAIGGKITVKVTQKINGVDKELMIPVHMFSAKYKNDGNPNPAYASIDATKNNLVSIAASDEDHADRIRLTGSLEMNEYYSQNGQLVSFPRIKASFVNKISKEICNQRAEGEIEFCVAEKIEEIENDEPTGRLIVRGIVPQYGGKIDVIPFYVTAPTAIDVANTYWNEGDSVRVQIKLNFSSTTKQIIEEVDFGDPIVRNRTVNVSEVIISGGNRAPLDEEEAFGTSDIQTALAERKARLEAQKAKDAAKASAPAQKKLDLGF